MNAEQRINELTKRQVFYGSSLVCHLRKLDGQTYYDIYAWLNQGKTDNKTLVTTDVYYGQDPDDLFKVVLSELGVKKIKLGVPQ